MRCRVWKEESRQWEGDEDDFDALHQTWWGRNAYVEGGAVIMLRRLGEGGEPGAGLWARYGRVAEGVREDDGVVLHLREERLRGWCAHEQVHVEFRGRQVGALFAVSKAWRSPRLRLGEAGYNALVRMLGAEGPGAHVLEAP